MLPAADPSRGRTSRRGRDWGKFRKDLDERGGTRAPSPAARSGDLLRASHVKPWRNSDHVERLDPANGILLMANIDILFDKGYVSFDDDGRMLTSRLSFSVSHRQAEHVDKPQPLQKQIPALC